MEEKLVLHIEIHQLRDRGLRIVQIAKRLRISRNTVYKYLDMSFEDAVNEFSQTGRKKKLDEYKDWIVGWLLEFPSLTGAQVLDWLQEKYPEIDVGESTVRRYVNEIREIYQIDKVDEPREYEAVIELPPGKQLQVDWGQTIQKTSGGKEVKLYFVAFVLAHSRHKFTVWLDRPFTTRDTIARHEKAFQFYGGITDEIVYDQDNLIAVSENAGDLILTKEFQQYIKDRKFKIYLCRKADPESKGKIESVVKYVKYNFAKNRIYTTLEDWNERSLKWLERTGNYKVHNTTKKRPFEVFLLEKQHLKKVSTPLPILESNHTEIITRNVNKDNTVRYTSNRYSVPLGTYTNYPVVQIVPQGQKLKILAPHTGEILAEHTISLEKGKLIKNLNHGRDRSKSLDELQRNVLTLFPYDGAEQYIQDVCHTYGRYRRDQLLLFQKIAKENPEWLSAAIHKCIQEKLYSANEFRDVVAYFKRTNIEPEQPITTVKESKESLAIAVQTRDLKEYIQRMGGK